MQRVKQEVRLQLALQRLELRLRQSRFQLRSPEVAIAEFMVVGSTRQRTRKRLAAL